MTENERKLIRTCMSNCLEFHSRSRKRRNAERKRKALKVLGILALGLIIALLCGMGINRPKITGYDYKTGTSLWDLASDCPDSVDKRQMIAEIMAVNAMIDSTVYGGRLYQVPVYK